MKTPYLFFLFTLCTIPSVWTMSEPDTTVIPPIPLSVIEIPVRLHRTQLQADINRQLGDTLFNDKNADGENLEILARKASEIEIQLTGQEIFYKVPLDLSVRKKMRLANLQGAGAITLNFKTRYQILADWSLETHTELVDFQWIKKPVLKTSVIDIPLQFVADIVIKKSRKKLTSAIDDQVKANLDLRKEVNSAWSMLHEPFLLSEEYATWMVMRPKSIYMTPFQTDFDTVQSVIGMESELIVLLGEEPAAGMPGILPALEWRKNDNKGFSLSLQADIPYVEAERLAREGMVGQRFEQGKKRYVVVEDLKLFRQGDKLVVQTFLSGSYKGAINLLSTPVYSEAKGKIELDDMDIELKTKNLLHKTLGWLFKGVFKNEIRKSLDHYLNFYLDQTKKTLQEELKDVEVAPGIQLRGQLSRLGVDHIFLTPDAMRLWIGMKGEIEVDVDGLSFK
ncbi:MAG: DUF4403 family protein [Saprospirales bacterium]|nr:DUF4403 family protein [Saprospirales bacterium]